MLSQKELGLVQKRCSGSGGDVPCCVIDVRLDRGLTALTSKKSGDICHCNCLDWSAMLTKHLLLRSARSHRPDYERERGRAQTRVHGCGSRHFLNRSSVSTVIHAATLLVQCERSQRAHHPLKFVESRMFGRSKMRRMRLDIPMLSHRLVRDDSLEGDLFSLLINDDCRIPAAKLIPLPRER